MRTASVDTTPTVPLLYTILVFVLSTLIIQRAGNLDTGRTVKQWKHTITKKTLSDNRYFYTNKTNFNGLSCSIFAENAQILITHLIQRPMSLFNQF